MFPQSISGSAASEALGALRILGAPWIVELLGRLKPLLLQSFESVLSFRGLVRFWAWRHHGLLQSVLPPHFEFHNVFSEAGRIAESTDDAMLRRHMAGRAGAF